MRIGDFIFQDHRFQALTHSSVSNSKVLCELARNLRHFEWRLLHFGARCSRIAARAIFNREWFLRFASLPTNESAIPRAAYLVNRLVDCFCERSSDPREIQLELQPEVDDLTKVDFEEGDGEVCAIGIAEGHISEREQGIPRNSC